MKRDDDLIRCLLLKMEESEYSDYVCSLTIGSEPEEEREYFHLQLLSDAGYVLETGHHSGVFRLTNQGYDYLNTIRDGEIWNKTKVAAKGVGGGTFEIIKDIATAYIKAELKLRLGLDL
ncbi:MAG: hypothetical protein CFE27_08760 [Alphaproteobacteria bacterium PA1]|nr:MAG: hypothetical protein CFE27_08760 [Alphaproteobacteria bacterium PA1]